MLFAGDYIWSLKRHLEIGWFVIAVIGSNILFNVTLCLIDAIKSCIKSIKAKLLRRKRLREYQHRMKMLMEEKIKKTKEKLQKEANKQKLMSLFSSPYSSGQKD